MNLITKDEVLATWKTPRAPLRKTCLAFAREYSFIAIRLAVIATILLVAFYFLCEYLEPGALPLRLIVISVVMIMGFIGLLPLSFLMPLIAQQEYQLTDKGIRFSNRTIRWDQILAAKFEADPEFPGVTLVKIQLKFGVRAYQIDTELFEREIKPVFESRVKLEDFEKAGVPEPLVISGWTWTFLALVMLAYLGAGAWLTVWLADSRILKYLITASMVATLIIGPGSIGCVLLYGLPLFKDPRLKPVIAVAFAFNMLASFLLMIIQALILILMARG